MDQHEASLSQPQYKKELYADDHEVNPPTSTIEVDDKRQSLDRFIGFIASVAFGANLQASWESVAVSFQAGLLNGGPTALIYGSILAFFGTLALSSSLAELASIHPTVGAQYRWTVIYAPRLGNPKFWGLLQGWITVFAWIATLAQPAFIIGTTIQGLIVLNIEDYEYQRWHGTLLAWAVFAIPVLTNIFARKLLYPIEAVGGFTHLGFLLVWVVVLVKFAPHSSSDFVFKTTFTDLSGWTHPGASWCIGLLSAVFPLTGFDGVIHMSDEIRNPTRAVPRAMVYSVIINGLTAICFMITVLFCLGDPEAALNTPTGYPIIQVIYNATQSKVAATVMVCLIVFNGMVAMFSSLASVTRLFWAFAHDNGLPFSDFLGKAHPTLRIPLHSLMAVTSILLLLILISIGSSSALFAILSLSSIGLYLSYVIPILFFIMAKLGDHDIQYGPYRFKPFFGLVVNAFALLYGIFILIWLPFPAYLPVTAENFNYSGPIMIFVVSLACLDWLFSGKTRFSPQVYNVASG